jgi:streptogramin lyase
MTTSGTITASHVIPVPNADPTSLATDRRGRIWIAEHSAGQLQRMTLKGDFGRPIRTRHAPDSLAFDRRGDLWYTASSDSRIGRVDVD